MANEFSTAINPSTETWDFPGAEWDVPMQLATKESADDSERLFALAEIAALESVKEVIDEVQIPGHVVSADVVIQVLEPAVENAVYDTLRALRLMGKLIEPIPEEAFQETIARIRGENA